MSLDVYLMGEPQEIKCTCSGCGNEHTTIDREELYSANITHNLNKMSKEAGIYEALWRPEELSIKKAKKLVPLLSTGLRKLKDDPEHFKKFNSSNGWGMYENFVPFVEKYLEACILNPNANIEVSR